MGRQGPQLGEQPAQQPAHPPGGGPRPRSQQRGHHVLHRLGVEGHRRDERQVAPRIVVAVEQREFLLPMGRVVGRIRLTSQVPGKPLASAAYPRRAVGDHDAPPQPEIRNVVVYLKDAAWRGALGTSHSELRQEHETFIPHTIAVTRGSSVEFPNDDPFFHNVFSLSRAANFNLGRYARGLFDLPMRNCTIELDGTIVVDAGRLIT